MYISVISGHNIVDNTVEYKIIEGHPDVNGGCEPQSQGLCL